MEKRNEIKVFEDKQVRTLWDAVKEKWYISIARNARKELEERTGKKVVTSLNAKTALQLKEAEKKKT